MLTFSVKGLFGGLLVRSAARLTVFLTVAFALAVPGAPACAGMLVPNPAIPTPIPDGYTNRSDAFVVNVTPNPAQFREQGNCPWLLPALTAEGFAKVDNTNPRGYSGANGWTINFATLQGSFTRNTYYPYATKVPDVSLGGLTVPAVNNAGYGGAVMALTYTPAGSDPTGANAEWIQVVKTNYAFGADSPMKKNGYDAGGGFTYFVDDFYPANTPANNGTMNPTYDGGYTKVGDTYTPKGFAANPTTFIDVPFLPLTNGLDTEFQVFLATDDAANKKLTIYDGVWWGFQVAAVPEPTSLRLVGIGILGMAAYAWRRRRKGERAAGRMALP